MGESFSRFHKTDTTLPFPEQFISLLDKTPCYIYPTKIADDILPAAPRHMVLSITPVTAEQDCQSDRCYHDTKLQRKTKRNLVGTNARFLCWLILVVRGTETHTRANGITGLSLSRQLGYYQAAKHSPPTRFIHQHSAEVLCERFIRLLCCCEKQNKLISLSSTLALLRLFL